MLEATHKKDRMIFSILSTLLFVTASSAIYDTSTATASYETTKAKLITYSVPAPKQNLFDSITIVDRYTSRIDDLEATIEEKDSTIYIVKSKAQQDLENLRNTYVSMDQALYELSQYVGKTPYGFGDSPNRWDCSGLTLWFYQEYRGITLPHSASAQMRGGEIVDAPIPGDIVAFTRKGSKNAYHVGIYVGAGKFIHAMNPGRDTVLQSVSDFAEGAYSNVYYIRY